MVGQEQVAGIDKTVEGLTKELEDFIWPYFDELSRDLPETMAAFMFAMPKKHDVLRFGCLWRLNE